MPTPCRHSVQEYKTHKESYVKKFELTKLPPYLILCVKVVLDLALALPPSL